MMKDFIKAVCALTIFCTCALASLQAAPFDSILNKNGVIEEVDTGADTYEYVGNNIIARGHVYIKFGNNTMTAERAVINLDSQDIDLSGNITFTSRAIDFKYAGIICIPPALIIPQKAFIVN
ncbi:MAG: hypothetical protein IKK25_08475 [Lentisphaeria bacterium]|nr:hypothetical protein [Lentisphaeria bacterium]